MKMLSAAVLAGLLAGASFPAFAAGDKIREIHITTRPQAAEPAEFQFVQIIAQEWAKLGLPGDVGAFPDQQHREYRWVTVDELGLDATIHANTRAYAASLVRRAV